MLIRQAKDDVNDILNYLLENVFYGAAVDTRRQIIDGIHRLMEMPEARSPVQEMVELTGAIIFRQIVIKKACRIIYRIREVQKDVVVIRVVHTKRGKGFVQSALE